MTRRFPALLALLAACAIHDPDAGKSEDPLVGNTGSAPDGALFQCFSPTGQCVTGAFLATFEKYGLASIGYPLTPRRVELLEDGKTLAEVQWFERARFEDHGGTVMLARLGARALERIEGGPFTPGVDRGPKPGCRLVPETKHYVCGELLSAFDRLGVERIGLPLTESTDGGESQWFERGQLRINHDVADETSPWRVLGEQVGRSEMIATSDFVTTPSRPFSQLGGWAYSARPELTRAQIDADMKKMAQAGANVVYVSHSNPGEVSPDSEPGLTFAVWDAIRTGSPDATKAAIQVQRIHDCVDSAKAAGLKVVLAIGYQFEMGAAWSDRHPDDIRRDADGTPMLTWTEARTGRTASPYSPVYRADIAEYWRWVDASFVAGNSHVVALNLGDEPMGADWSIHAKNAFAKRYGASFDSAPAEARGHFLAGVLADYANDAAGTWLRIDPAVRVLNTFHIQRDRPWFPDFERVFAETPANYVFSSDTHLHDAPPDQAPLDLAMMDAQARTLGWLSHVYHKPVMLWSSANDWGLGCDRGRGSCLFHQTDAVAQVGRLVDDARSVGGDVGMVMAFGYNQRYLGAFGPGPNAALYDPQALFEGVSAALVAVRPRMIDRGASVPDTLVVARPALERYVANRLPVLQRTMRGGAHVTEKWVDLASYHDLLAARGVVLVSGHASEAGGRSITLPSP